MDVNGSCAVTMAKLSLWNNELPSSDFSNETISDHISRLSTFAIAITLAYIIAFIMAVVGNVLVLSVIYKNPRMYSVINIFIVNLAVADLLVAVIVLPITLVESLTPDWPFGEAMCKVVPFLQGLVVSASVNTLAAIAIERYLAICQAMKNRMSKKASRIAIGLIWLGSGIIMIPWVKHYTFHVADGKRDCTEKWENKNYKNIYFIAAIFFTCFALPLLIITVCYSLIGFKVWRRQPPGVAPNSKSKRIIHQSRVKVVKMLLVVCIIFAASWLPLYGIRIFLDFGPVLDMNSTKLLKKFIFPFFRLLGTSNCSVNPLIYCFFSKKFRNGFSSITKSCTCERFNEGHVNHDGSSADQNKTSLRRELKKAGSNTSTNKSSRSYRIQFV